MQSPLNLARKFAMSTINSEMKSLPKDTVRLIGSSQVITSVYSVVKELLENSLDAGATAIEVKLENYGFDKVEVRDNGCGISKVHIPSVALRYHTSKIASFNDLESLTTFGFRGEALGSLCAVSDLTVTSKTSGEDVSHSYNFDHNGKVISDQPSHLGQGTTILASNLFSNMPVRRQYYKAVKKRREEMKKVEDLCLAYGIIKPGVRLTLRHNKELVLQKTPAPDTRSALLSVLGRKVFSNVEYKSVQLDEDIGVNIEAFLPKSDSDVSTTSRSNNDRSFLSVNGRPVLSKDVDKCVRKYYCHAHQCEGRHPVYYISLQVPPTQLDVNVDPNKSHVMLHQQKQIINTIKTLCEDVYGLITKPDKSTEPAMNCTDITLNDSVCSNTSDNLSYIVHDEDRTCSNSNRPENGKAAESSVSSRLNDKFGNTMKQRGNSVTDMENSDQSKKGFLIEYHSDNRMKETTVAARSSEGCNKENINTELSVTSDNNNSDLIDRESGEGKEKTEEEVNFDILDADLKDLIQTQESNSDSGVLMNLDLESCLSDLHEFTEIVHESDPNKKHPTDGNKQTVDTSESSEVVVYMNGINQEHNIGENPQNKISKSSLDETVDGTKKDADDQCKDEAGSWSRGTIPQTSDGSHLQPVTLLVPGLVSDRNKRPPSPSQDLDVLGFTPPAKKKALSVKMDQPRLYEVLGSSGDKFASGFVAFSKQVRPKVVEDNPDASYDDITAMVKAQWDKLPLDDREEFRHSGSQQIQELRKTVTSENKKQLIGPKLDKRLAPVKGLPSIKDQLLAAAGKQGESKKPIKSVKVAFSLNKLKQMFSTDISTIETQENKDMKLIGPLKYYNGWVCYHGNQLKLINPHRVEEMLLHRELLEDHVIKVSQLDEPQVISESSVGGQDRYQTLLDLIPKDGHQTYTYIDDKRLTANGIQVRCHLDQYGKPVCELTGLATGIPTYGQTDLQEILDLITNTGATTLYKARPLKVVYYLQGEAVRMVRQRPMQRTREDMLDVIQQIMTSLPVDCVQCLHNKPFLHTMYDMEKIPVTQSQV